MVNEVVAAKKRGKKNGDPRHESEDSEASSSRHNTDDRQDHSEESDDSGDSARTQIPAGQHTEEEDLDGKEYPAVVYPDLSRWSRIIDNVTDEP